MARLTTRFLEMKRRQKRCVIPDDEDCVMIGPKPFPCCECGKGIVTIPYPRSSLMRGQRQRKILLEIKERKRTEDDDATSAACSEALNSCLCSQDFTKSVSSLTVGTIEVVGSSQQDCMKSSTVCSLYFTKSLSDDDSIDTDTLIIDPIEL